MPLVGHVLRFVRDHAQRRIARVRTQKLDGEGTQFWRNPHGYRLRYSSRDARLVGEPSDALDDASVQVGRIWARRGRGGRLLARVECCFS